LVAEGFTNGWVFSFSRGEFLFRSRDNLDGGWQSDGGPFLSSFAAAKVFILCGFFEERCPAPGPSSSSTNRKVSAAVPVSSRRVRWNSSRPDAADGKSPRFGQVHHCHAIRRCLMAYPGARRLLPAIEIWPWEPVNRRTDRSLTRSWAAKFLAPDPAGFVDAVDGRSKSPGCGRLSMALKTKSDHRPARRPYLKRLVARSVARRRSRPPTPFCLPFSSRMISSLKFRSRPSPVIVGEETQTGKSTLLEGIAVACGPYDGKAGGGQRVTCRSIISEMRWRRWAGSFQRPLRASLAAENYQWLGFFFFARRELFFFFFFFFFRLRRYLDKAGPG